MQNAVTVRECRIISCVAVLLMLDAPRAGDVKMDSGGLYTARSHPRRLNEHG